MHYCKPILDIVFAFVVRCFVEYEKTIAILEKTVQRLQRGESKGTPPRKVKICVIFKGGIFP